MDKGKSCDVIYRNEEEELIGVEREFGFVYLEFEVPETYKSLSHDYAVRL